VKSDIKVSKAASSMLQVFIENTTIDLCKNANILAIHAGRKTLFIDDLRLVVTLVKDPLDFIQDIE
jgi:histone H3/H4